MASILTSTLTASALNARVQAHRVSGTCDVPRFIAIHGWPHAAIHRPSRYTRPLSAVTRSIEEDKGDKSTSPEAVDADALQIEQMMTSKRKSKKGQAPEPAKPYKVVSATRDSVYGDQPPSQIQQFETAVVQILALLFLLILAEGIFLGASGFMSAEMDQLAQDVVYPLFTPTLAVFLAGSTAYGLWKTKEDDRAKE